MPSDLKIQINKLEIKKKKNNEVLEKRHCEWRKDDKGEEDDSEEKIITEK